MESEADTTALFNAAGVFATFPSGNYKLISLVDNVLVGDSYVESENLVYKFAIQLSDYESLPTKRETFQFANRTFQMKPANDGLNPLVVFSADKIS